MVSRRSERKKTFCHNSILLSIQYVNLLLFSVFCLFNVFIIIKKFRLMFSLHSASCSVFSVFAFCNHSCKPSFIHLYICVAHKEANGVNSFTCYFVIIALTGRPKFGHKKTTTSNKNNFCVSSNSI